jgi:hypothetical protein
VCVSGHQMTTPALKRPRVAGACAILLGAVAGVAVQVDPPPIATSPERFADLLAPSDRSSESASQFWGASCKDFRLGLRSLSFTSYDNAEGRFPPASYYADGG